MRAALSQDLEDLKCDSEVGFASQNGLTEEMRCKFSYPRVSYEIEIVGVLNMLHMGLALHVSMHH